MRSHLLTPLVDPPAAWDPAFGLIGPHAPASLVEWPLTRADAEAMLPASPSALRRSAFESAESLYQVWCTFVRPWARLLGWWAADVPAYGFVMRIVYDPSHAGEEEGRACPAFVCQKVHVVNRLQGMTPPHAVGGEAWNAATSFAMPLGVGVSRDGASLRGQLNLDLSAPGVKTETLWTLRWDDVRAALRRGDAKQVLPTRAWATFDEDECSSADTGTGRAPQLDDELQAGSPVLDAAQPTSLDSEPPPAAGQRVVSKRDGYLHVTHIASSAISTSTLQAPTSTPSDAVRLDVHSFLPYAQSHLPTPHLDTEDLSPALAALVDARRRVPLPTLPFPTKALLPALRPLDSNARRLTQEEEEPRVDALLMSPAPPYRPWPHLAPPLKAGPRFFPLRSPPRNPVCAPARRAVAAPASDAGSDEAGPSSAPAAATAAEKEAYIHTPPPSHCDPAQPEFDWSLLEGLYATTYGPWGLELIYVRSRLLVDSDFTDASSALDDEASYRRLAEPLLSTAEMYAGTQIDVASVRVGARIVEGVKVSGDPHVPRGQITFRAFVDDPARVATPWRPPPAGYANHTPWPFRAPLAEWERASGAEAERSPGLVSPGHGRLAGEGFVAPGWVSSIVSRLVSLRARRRRKADLSLACSGPNRLARAHQDLVEPHDERRHMRQAHRLLGHLSLLSLL